MNGDVFFFMKGDVFVRERGIPERINRTALGHRASARRNRVVVLLPLRSRPPYSGGIDTTGHRKKHAQG